VSTDQSIPGLLALAGLFLKLGFTAFGGPAAHIAMMEDEVVRRRQWLTHEEFLDLLGATNLIPGPNSTEMAIHIGHRKGGWVGLVLAGVCFIVPAVVIVLAFAWAYMRYGSLPQAEGILWGIKPVIIAVVVQALLSLGKSALKAPFLVVLAASVAALTVIGLNELVLLLAAGTVATAARFARKWRRAIPAILPVPAAPAIFTALSVGVPAGFSAAFGLWPLFLFFLKIGSVLYGSGYVLLAFLRSGLVERSGWLTEEQLLDAVAVGQFTPGPVFTTATFIGYILGGVPAAIVATAGIFLPAFFFVALSGPLIPRIRRSPAAGAFLDGVNAASLALMAVVTGQLGMAALVDWAAVLLAIGSAALLFGFRVNSAWLVLGGACIGALKALAT
jgi:chromate transporter